MKDWARISLIGALGSVFLLPAEVEAHWPDGARGMSGNIWHGFVHFVDDAGVAGTIAVASALILLSVIGGGVIAALAQRIPPTD